jgi:hypothetical protein
MMQLLDASQYARRLAGEQIDIHPWAAREADPSGLGSEGVLARLAPICIRSDPADPGARSLGQSLPYLRTTRARQGLKLVRLLDMTAESNANWILTAARWTIHYVCENFGSAQLMQALVAAFPRDKPAGFARQLMTRAEFRAMLDAVQLDRLAEWVREAFRPVNFALLHYEIIAEFEAAAESFRAREDAVAVDQMREAIRRHPQGKTAKAESLCRQVGIETQAGRSALRYLEALGEYEGFTRKKPRRYQSR